MRREEGQHPPPPPPLLLPLASAPALSWDARCRKQRWRPSASRQGRRVPLTPCPRPPDRAETPARASRGLPPHFSRSRGISKQQLEQQARGPPGEKEQRQPRHISGASSDPALAKPQPPEARGPGSHKPPYPRREQKRSPRSPVAAAATALSRSCRALGSGRGGWVEDATPG